MHQSSRGESRDLSTFPSRVLLVSALPVVLTGLRAMLAPFRDFVVVGEVMSADQSRFAAAQIEPDFVLVDASTVGEVTPTLCMQLAREAPSSMVVILAKQEEGRLLRDCLHHEATGLLALAAYGDEIVHHLRAIRAGVRVVDDRLASRLAGADSPVEPEDSSHPRLTSRERQVLNLLAAGMTSRQVAAMLALSPNTIRGYAQNLLTKLQAPNRVQAVERARRMHLL